jgi:hypothetical protein
MGSVSPLEHAYWRGQVREDGWRQGSGEFDAKLGGPVSGHAQTTARRTADGAVCIAHLARTLAVVLDALEAVVNARRSVVELSADARVAGEAADSRSRSKWRTQPDGSVGGGAAAGARG